MSRNPTRRASQRGHATDMRPRWRPADVWWRRSAAPRPIISPPHVRRLRERRKHHLYVPAERSGAGTSQPNGSSTDLWDRDDPSDGGGQRPRPGRRMPAWALLKWIGTKTLATPTDDPASVHKPLRPSSPLHPGRGEALGAPLPRSPAPLSLWLLEGGEESFHMHSAARYEAAADSNSSC